MGDINLPSGYGGLMRYNEEYSSKFVLKPYHVVAFVIAIVVFVIAIKSFFPITA